MTSDVLFEFSRIGQIMRVTAVDSDTGTEAIIQGPVTASRAELQRVALSKLHYVLSKQKGNQDGK
ncbi:MAG: hypothetical protein PHX43_01665 [Alphaproteobacteria bacterium]|nr:hypothetical protein [Alphaproteobacteria bacterium]